MVLSPSPHGISLKISFSPSSRRPAIMVNDGDGGDATHEIRESTTTTTTHRLWIMMINCVLISSSTVSFVVTFNSCTCPPIRNNHNFPHPPPRCLFSFPFSITLSLSVPFSFLAHKKIHHFLSSCSPVCLCVRCTNVLQHRHHVHTSMNVRHTFPTFSYPPARPLIFSITRIRFN